MQIDAYFIAAEPSADLHGAGLIKHLLQMRPNLKIAAICGPRMRKLPIHSFFSMEQLQVMGFIDVAVSFFRILRLFFAIRNHILSLNPKILICIDYPGFHLRLQKSLKKKGFRGKLIHYVCPTVWAWGKHRIPRMAKTLDLLITLFPFEKKCFSSTSLHVEYVGHPLVAQIPKNLSVQPAQNRILALFPGSRNQEILRNFPIQLAAARKLFALDPTLTIASSIAHPSQHRLLSSMSQDIPITFFPFEKNYELMQKAHTAIATSGTVTLELALHSVPTVVNFSICPVDLFLAQKIFRINLAFYCIVNILASECIFPELFGPNLEENKLFSLLKTFWTDAAAHNEIKLKCDKVRDLLGDRHASEESAKLFIQAIEKEGKRIAF